jgi:hypothetical protein
MVMNTKKKKKKRGKKLLPNKVFKHVDPAHITDNCILRGGDLGPWTVCKLTHKNGTVAWGMTKRAESEPVDYWEKLEDCQRNGCDEEQTAFTLCDIPNPKEIARGRAEIAMRKKLRGKQIHHLYMA